MKVGLVQLCWSHSYDHVMCSIANKHAPPVSHQTLVPLPISPHFSNLIICIYTTTKHNHCYLCKCCVHVEVGTICCHVQTLKSLQNTKYDVISKLQLAASWKEILKLCTLLLVDVKHFSEISDNVLQKQLLRILFCFNYLCFPCRELTQVSLQISWSMEASLV
jgi:hypothetical protein